MKRTDDLVANNSILVLLLKKRKMTNSVWLSILAIIPILVITAVIGFKGSQWLAQTIY